MNDAGRRPILRTDNLGLRIGGVPIVDGVSLDVEDGEFLVIIGPNGAGKTTLLNLLCGVARPTSGRIFFEDRDVTHAPPYERARLGMGRSFQTSTVFPGLSTLENARIAAQAHVGGSGAIWRRADGDRDVVGAAERALSLVGLAERAHAHAAALSHGEKRKLDFAMLLCAQARVMLLDEPTAGMAAEDVPGMMELLARLHRESRNTVVMVEHRMDLIMNLAERIAVMHHGTLLALDVPERIVANEIVQTAYLGDPL